MGAARTLFPYFISHWFAVFCSLLWKESLSRTLYLLAKGRGSAGCLSLCHSRRTSLTAHPTSLRGWLLSSGCSLGWPGVILASRLLLCFGNLSCRKLLLSRWGESA